MNASSEVLRNRTAGEISSLQRCINDLIRVLGLSATWTGGEPPRIVSTLCDALLRMLRAELVYARVRNPADGALIERLRIAQSPQAALTTEAVARLLVPWAGDDPQRWPSVAQASFGDAEISMVSQRLGVYGDSGLIVVGARRPDFPRQTEGLLLSVAVNQAAYGLQEARHEELKRAQDELRNAQAELAHVTRLMTAGALTASIAHEVNQPLSGIVTNASTCLRMLAGTPPNLDGARETVRRTLRDAHRASEVIARLRGLFARKDIVSESVDLNEAAREVIALCSAVLQRNHVVLRMELAEQLPSVIGDRVQLQQVILNLLTNASDAMTGIDDRPRELHVRTALDEGDLVRVTVSDTGSGFRPEDAERLCTAFYTTKSGGMGIGLSVSRSIIESHRGHLWAACNSGPGATFSFSIPCDAGRAGTRDHPQPQPQETGIRPVRAATTADARDGASARRAPSTRPPPTRRKSARATSQPG